MPDTNLTPPPSRPTPLAPTAKQRLAETFDLFPNVNDALVLGLMIVLSYTGIAVTTVAPHASRLYWLALALLFAGISMYAQWARQADHSKPWSVVLRTQMLQWGGLVFAILIAYMLLGTSRLTYESAGFVVHLLLAFAMFIVGVYVDWRFYIVGAFLALSLIIAIYISVYMWVLLILAGVFVAGTRYLNARSGPSEV
jgi:hypothetical protein